eukprot:INCI10167.2.p2 GENE.INCI10167.2~~INCI10167.2.p2  ORF type:complete len:271 (-),score=68.25 INCI10167.2:112-924(-)
MDEGRSLLSGSWKLELRRSDHISPVLSILGAGWFMCTVADRLGEVLTLDFSPQQQREQQQQQQQQQRGDPLNGNETEKDSTTRENTQSEGKCSSTSNNSGRVYREGKAERQEEEKQDKEEDDEEEQEGAEKDGSGGADRRGGGITATGGVVRVSTRRKLQSEDSETFVMGEPKQIRDDHNPKYFFTTTACLGSLETAGSAQEDPHESNGREDDDAAVLTLSTKLSMNRGVMSTVFRVTPSEPNELVSTIRVRHRNGKKATVTRRYKRVVK